MRFPCAMLTSAITPCTRWSASPWLMRGALSINWRSCDEACLAASRGRLAVPVSLVPVAFLSQRDGWNGNAEQRFVDHGLAHR